MDSSRTYARPSSRLVRRFGIGIAIGLMLAGSQGCARMRSFRQADEGAMLGKVTEPVDSPSGALASGARASGTRNARADRASGVAPGPGPERSQPSLAQAPAGRVPSRIRTTAAPSSSHRGRSNPAPVQIALEPPIALDEPTPVDPPREIPPGELFVSPAPAPSPEKAEAAQLPIVEAPVTPEAPTVTSIVAASRAKLDSIESYRLEMNRQERVGENLQPAEDVILNIRRNPSAVRIEWPSGPSKGREVIYEAARNDNLMHVRQPNGLVPRISLAVDNPLVARTSRYPITEAGFDMIVRNLEAVVASPNGDGAPRYEGVETPAEIGRPCHKLVRTTGEGDTWTVLIYQENHLPAKVEAVNVRGELLERYLFRNTVINPEDLASRDAFDPDRRWGESQGLFGKLARATTGPAATTANSPR